MLRSNNTHKMVDTQHFCLRWNNYQSSITSAFENLRDDEDFVDVTLACDGRSLKAHRVVLSACSPYFRELLKVSVHTPKAHRNRWDSKSLECILCLTSFVIAERLKWLQFRKRLCGYQEKAILPKRTCNVPKKPRLSLLIFEFSFTTKMSKTHLYRGCERALAPQNV